MARIMALMYENRFFSRETRSGLGQGPAGLWKTLRLFLGALALHATVMPALPAPAAAAAEADPPGEATWVIIPILLVSPENGVGGGAKYFDKAWLRPDQSLDLQAYITTKSQYSLQVEHRRLGLFAPFFESRSLVEYFFFPESFFGQGNDPRDEDEHIYSPRGLRLGQEAVFHLPRSLRARLVYSLKQVEMEDIERALGGGVDSAVVPAGLTGREGGFSDRADFVFEYDSRDVELVPSGGALLGLRVGHAAAGSFRYGLWEGYAGRYLSFGPSWETALKVTHRSIFGDPPFYELPYLGDAGLLRGVPEKRLRDRAAQVLQGEVRRSVKFGRNPRGPLKTLHWWQVALFAEAGRVGADAARIWENEVHVSGGVGLRLILGERLAAIRADLGFSAFGDGLYLDFGQAF